MDDQYFNDAFSAWPENLYHGQQPSVNSGAPANANAFTEYTFDENVNYL